MAGETAPHSQRVLRRCSGKGWLGLASDLERLGKSLDVLGEHLLVHTDFTRRPRLVLGPQAKRASAEAFQRSLETWLGTEARSQTLAAGKIDGWSGEGLVVLAGGATDDWVQVLSPSSPDDVLMEGTTLLAVGSAAEALGQWIFAAGARSPTAGLSWLPGAIILSHLEAPTALEAVHTFLARELYLYALSLPAEGALALGPDGEVELWSREAPTVILGAGWRQA